MLKQVHYNAPLCAVVITVTITSPASS